MNLKVLCVSFITLLVALAVNSANAKTRNYLSHQCQKEASVFYEKRVISFNDFRIIDDDEYIYLPTTILKRKGVGKVEIRAVAITHHNSQNFYALQFNWKNQSVIDCRSWYHAPLVTLIETYKYYTPLHTS